MRLKITPEIRATPNRANEAGSGVAFRLKLESETMFAPETRSPSESSSAAAVTVLPNATVIVQDDPALASKT
jgi:hypothetical protein